jgi:Co/Zn/Cd efflux system component
VLLDAEMDAPVVREVHDVIQSLPHSAEVRDLHIWRVGKGKYACIVSVIAEGPISADEVRHRLAAHDELVHITVEVAARTSGSVGQV